MPPNQPKRRRLLSVPAVCPCESVAPASLLASLLSLAADLASRSGTAGAFPVLQRGARHAVRVAGILLAFLEEIQDAAVTASSESLPAAAVLGLTELHVAMQKLRFLLTDLARRGARLWVLVNAGVAASELRAALGSVAAAVDVLPRRVADASVEAGELARLASDHAWRAAVWPDPGDERAARSVRSILDQFKSGVSPDAEDVRRVLHRIGVRGWSDCSDEIACLEDELRARASDGGDGVTSDAVLINTLIAFLVYCRVVLFDHIDSASHPDHNAASTASRCPDWIRPDALRCPITLDLMTDPVTVSTGQTYDRASITRWIKAGCHTCPVTGERLRTADVVPNAALRGIVEQLLQGNGVSLPPSSSDFSAGHHHRRHGALGDTAVPFAPAAAGAARLAVAYVVAQLRTGSTAERRKATSETRKLSKHNAVYRARLVDANAVPWLLCLLSSTDACVQDNAVASLLNLSKHPRGRTALFEAGGVGLVVDVINVGARAEARQNAAAVLFYLASSPEQAEEIGRVPEAIPTLVQLVRDGGHRGRKNAMVSLYGLLQCPANHGKAVAAGAVSALAALLSSASAPAPDDELAGDAVTLLARLAEQPVGALAILARPGLVARVAEVLTASASRSGTKDHCVALLVSLCRHAGDKLVALLGRMPGLMASLYSLIADGSPQTCKRARALLNLIHRHYEMTHPSSAPASEAGERVVRVL